MAETIVSPGVFTRENDLSFLPQGIAEIGAAFVGPFSQGPAFIPTFVQGQEEFQSVFGTPDGNSYLGYTVQNYLEEAGSATIVRVLGMGGYSTNVGYLYASGSTSTKLAAVFHPTTSGSSIASIVAFGTTSSFGVVISSSNASGPHISGSGLNFNSASSAYVGSFFGNPNTLSTSPAYVYAIFPDAINQTGASQGVRADTASFDFTSASDKQYKHASTPWIISQRIGGTTKQLFKLHTLSDGVAANKQIKVSISNISPSTDLNITQYGTFDLTVREFDNADSAFAAISTEESYVGLTFDPKSPNYIALRIGNSAPLYDSTTNETIYDGEYPNRSRYIRVEMAGNIPATAVPYGYEAYQAVESSGLTPALRNFVVSRWNGGSYSATATLSNKYYGFNFDDPNCLSILGPVKSGAQSAGSGFSLETTPNGSLPTNEYNGSSLSLSDTTAKSWRRFTVGFQGGFDGLNPTREIAMGGAIRNVNSQGFDLSNSLASGSVAYKRALDALSNPDSVDLNLLVMPGVLYAQHPYVAQYAINVCEARGDCFYIMDLDTLDANISTVTSAARTLDTNYAAAYYPWVRIFDTNTGQRTWAPPSVVLPEVYKYNDNVGAEWFAPAGLNRGGIPGAIGVKTRLNQSQRDDLYESKVNPIAQFPGQGICVWGQKTLQTRPSALDRVNVRRLLITVKKFIASSARYLVFEQNTEATRQRFLNIVNPYLAGIQQNSGLTAFRVVMDDTNNTPDLIDRNILVGAIYLQPTRAVEFIKLDFNILPTGATFDTI